MKLQLAAVALMLSGCATLAKHPTIPVPDTFRQACERPDPQNVQTIGDLASFSLQQNAAITVCDAKREGLLDIIDATNKASGARRWWSRGR